MGEQYIHVTPKMLADLQEGKDVEITIGKRIIRTITTKTLYDIKREKAQRKYEEELAKIEKTTGVK